MKKREELVHECVRANQRVMWSRVQWVPRALRTAADTAEFRALQDQRDRYYSRWNSTGDVSLELTPEELGLVERTLAPELQLWEAAAAEDFVWVEGVRVSAASYAAQRYNQLFFLGAEQLAAVFANEALALVERFPFDVELSIDPEDAGRLLVVASPEYQPLVPAELPWGYDVIRVRYQPGSSPQLLSN